MMPRIERGAIQVLSSFITIGEHCLVTKKNIWIDHHYEHHPDQWPLGMTANLKCFTLVFQQLISFKLHFSQGGTLCDLYDHWFALYEQLCMISFKAFNCTLSQGSTFYAFYDHWSVLYDQLSVALFSQGSTLYAFLWSQISFVSLA